MSLREDSAQMSKATTSNSSTVATSPSTRARASSTLSTASPSAQQLNSPAEGKTSDAVAEKIAGIQAEIAALRAGEGNGDDDWAEVDSEDELGPELEVPVTIKIESPSALMPLENAEQPPVNVISPHSDIDMKDEMPTPAMSPEIHGQEQPQENDQFYALLERAWMAYSAGDCQNAADALCLGMSVVVSSGIARAYGEDGAGSGVVKGIEAVYNDEQLQRRRGKCGK